MYSYHWSIITTLNKNYTRKFNLFWIPVSLAIVTPRQTLQFVINLKVFVEFHLASHFGLQHFRCKSWIFFTSKNLRNLDKVLSSIYTLKRKWASQPVDKKLLSFIAQLSLFLRQALIFVCFFWTNFSEFHRGFLICSKWYPNDDVTRKFVSVTRNFQLTKSK